jgi:hypothetical protein
MRDHDVALVIAVACRPAPHVATGDTPLRHTSSLWQIA